eukprot:271723_1
MLIRKILLKKTSFLIMAQKESEEKMQMGTITDNETDDTDTDTNSEQSTDINIGIIIIARATSSRLPGKHFIKINNMSIIELIQHRIYNNVKGKYSIIIATGNKQQNHQFEKYIVKDTKIFYGDDENLPLRLYQCNLKYKFTHMFNYGGDNLFTTFNGINIIMKQMENISKNTFFEAKGLPIGMNVEGWTTDILDIKYKKYYNVHDSGNDWYTYLFDKCETKKVQIKLGSFDTYDTSNDSIRNTLDYECDKLFLEKLNQGIKINELINKSDIFIIDYVKKNNYHLVNNWITKEYWERYYSKEGADKPSV